MIIIKVDSNNIEKALKQLKYKVRSTRQTQELRDRKEFEKPSITKRKQNIKAKFIQSIRDQENKW
jgi:small subunit ribosomal protein S21|tara:strand:+ start:7197 stop:7391 length:195 start_codon:yes stop_codon:yes gene_type:complete